MWNAVVEMLQQKGSFGGAFRICCPKHQDVLIMVKTPENFETYSPEGGCGLPCTRLSCGHTCDAKCHSENMHATYFYTKACSRLNQTCGHSCQKPMRGEDCGPCRVLVDNVLLLCGHTLNQIECHKSQRSNTLHCNAQVEKTVLGCRHLIQIECGVNIAHKDFKCPTPCTEKLICGHDCSGSCGKCKPTAAVRLSMPSA